MRPPLDTASEFEPIDIALGTTLDLIAGEYGVTRLIAEPDESLRERTKDAAAIRRASDRTQRGESLVPDSLVGSSPPPGEPNPLVAENAQLRKDLVQAQDAIFWLRSILVEAKRAANEGSFLRFTNALERAGGILDEK